MTNEAKQIFLSIAPVFIERGIALQERIAAAGGDPSKCTADGKPIIEAYAASAKEWAETFARAIDAARAGSTASLIGREVRLRYMEDGEPAVSEGKIENLHCDDNSVTLTIGKVDFVLTNAEFDELMQSGGVVLGDYYLALVKE